MIDNSIALAKRGYARATSDKPRTAITVYVDDLTSERYRDGSYDGIPDLIENIQLQGKQGCTEASRAIRKKLKYGNVHNQLRALDVLNACVENGGARFEATFANERLVDRIREMSNDSFLDPKVYRRMMTILASWQRVFGKRSDMSLVAGLYSQCGGQKRKPSTLLSGKVIESKQDEEKYNALMKNERERALARRQVSANGSQARVRTGVPESFNFQKEKSKIQETIFLSNQAATNLVHALKLVNRERESIEQNRPVQQRLEAVKNLRKPLVRYIRLVQDEEFIGVLIEANELQLEALAIYDSLNTTSIDDDSEHELDTTLSRQMGTLDVTSQRPGVARSLSGTSVKSEIQKLQDRQQKRIQEARAQRSQGAHPDLIGLDLDPFAEKENSVTDGLQIPMDPMRSDAASRSSHSSEANLGSLSDYSDYSSDDEMARNDSVAGANKGRARASTVTATSLPRSTDETEDPFADPFADNATFSTDHREKPRMTWTEV